jgi:hypothetical protein
MRIVVTHSIDRYDPSDDPREDCWTEVARGVLCWRLRPIIHALEREGYNRGWSIYVRRDGLDGCYVQNSVVSGTGSAAIASLTDARETQDCTEVDPTNLAGG